MRLTSLLDEAVRAPLTVVTAPAGAGKTSLVSGWAAETTTPTAWLSFDETDADSARLWSGVVAALETLAPGCGHDASPLFLRPSTVTTAVHRLVDGLDADGRPPAALIVDDLHLVDGDTTAARSLALFLLHLPDWLHVVLLSRRDPRLPLDRLRARGQLREIHFAELRFMPDEAAEMLSRLAPALTRDQVTDTVRHAHGWAAGIRLMALAARAAHAQQRAARPAAHAGLMIEDYVVREVLGAESPAVTTALADIAVVERVNVSLAKALTDRDDILDLLLQAEARGLFLTRVDTSGWFELHALVRQVLVAQLSRQSADLLADLHARAARWFEGADETPLALDHWLRAGLPRAALRLLAAKNVELYDAGQEATIVQTLGKIPPRVAMADFASMLDFAWCHVLVDRRGFLDAVDRISWWAARSEHLARVASARLTMLRAIAATMLGDWASGTNLALRTSDDLDSAWWRDPIGRFGWNSVARALALDERWDDSSEDIRTAGIALSIDPRRRLAFEGTRALGEALAGRPINAVRVASGVRHAASVASMTILGAEVSTAEALAHRELGDRARAVAESAEIAETAPDPVLYCRVLALLNRAEAHVDDGDLETARQVFDRAQSLAEAELTGPGSRALVARVAARLSLATGDIERARRWSAQIIDPFWREVCGARLLLAEGQQLAATASLESARPRCVRHQVVRNLLLSRATDTRERAVSYAAAAAETAAVNGLVQTVVSEGPEVVELIEHAAWQLPSSWLDRLRRIAAPLRGELPAGRGGAAGEALTRRERDVVRFLPSRLSLPEIADELCISVNTLKFHVKLIYRKLGVNSRAEAAEAVRSMIAIRR
ncbi:LuxR C-terminal-related transcriptional regulator [Jiangella anatolica]|uniref:HTH luxR-type domain-containing protein n=1 Tax=Jiangella anatolica TaxID=2670374 RepID=A0A2W2CUH6_9ACTN|nr:LuxR C-terminal-related transcriptional regulator [Jiangella anatolica]PZF83833.1 hypothetical protein C1I92_11160 [Jiangella anatolica]